MHRYEVLPDACHCSHFLELIYVRLKIRPHVLSRCTKQMQQIKMAGLFLKSLRRHARNMPTPEKSDAEN